MPINRDEVERIARLAHLKLEERDRQRFIEQFQAILDHLRQIEEVVTDQVPPTFHARPESDLKTPLRDDEVRASLPVDKALANAPDPVDDQFRVPRVLD